ncbi:granule associated Rac and RHOG effector protein 1-like [Branchiostoma floridae]|uniref:Granule associated Rac and RHOG effector protein 1-like n=1 Tax=Branchiostoma floridae TaxID=7739 RepID=A0A9J7LB13_BRAFL|nr:granule associated Rac and RHOG effector protein 1-like [Branchiostoma floridae]
MENIRRHFKEFKPKHDATEATTAAGHGQGPDVATASTGGSGGAEYRSPSASMPVTLDAHVSDIQQSVNHFLNTLNSLCGAGTQLAEVFSTVFEETMLWDVTRQLVQVWSDVSLATSSNSTQVKEEVVMALSELALKGEGDASTEGNSSLQEQDLQVLGKCLQCMLNLQYQFLTSYGSIMAAVKNSAGNHASLLAAESRQHGDAVLQSSREVALHSWQTVKQMLYSLHQCQAVTLPDLSQQNLSEQVRRDAGQRLDQAWQVYKRTLERFAGNEFRLLGGFYCNPQALEQVLKGCCSDDEIRQSATNPHLTDPTTLIYKELARVDVQIGSVVYRGTATGSPGQNIKNKMVAMRQLLQGAAEQHGKGSILGSVVDRLTCLVLSQACPSVTHPTSKTAVQLCFGRAGLVSVSCTSLPRGTTGARVTVSGTHVVVQVTTAWCLQKDNRVLSTLQRTSDDSCRLGVVDAIYTAIIDPARLLDGREQMLPTVQVKLRSDMFSQDSGPPSATAPASQPVLADYKMPGETIQRRGSLEGEGGIKKTFNKLTSKFGRKGSYSPSPSNDATKQSAFYSNSSQPAAAMATSNGSRFSAPVADQSGTSFTFPTRPTDQSAKSMTYPSRTVVAQDPPPPEMRPPPPEMRPPPPELRPPPPELRPPPPEMRPPPPELRPPPPEMRPPPPEMRPPPPEMRKEERRLSMIEEQAESNTLEEEKKGETSPEEAVEGANRGESERSPSLATEEEIQEVIDFLSRHHKPQPLATDGSPPGNRSNRKSWTTEAANFLSNLRTSDPNSLPSEKSSSEDTSSQRSNSLPRPSDFGRNTWPSRIRPVSLSGNLEQLAGSEFSSDPEYAHYVASMNNYLQAQQSKVRHRWGGEGMRTQWSSQEGRLNSTWPIPPSSNERYNSLPLLLPRSRLDSPPLVDQTKAASFFDLPLSSSEALGGSNSWCNMDSGSASSSDDTSSTNGDVFSMGLGLTGNDLIQKCSSEGGESTPESEHLQGFLDELAQMEPKSTKTWPPKSPWQRSLPGGFQFAEQPPPVDGHVAAIQQWSDPLPQGSAPEVHPSVTAQWSDPIPMAATSPWSTAGDNSPSTPPPLTGFPPHNDSAMRGHPKLDRRLAYMPPYQNM